MGILKKYRVKKVFAVIIVINLVLAGLSINHIRFYFTKSSNDPSTQVDPTVSKLRQIFFSTSNSNEQDRHDNSKLNQARNPINITKTTVKQNHHVQSTISSLKKTSSEFLHNQSIPHDSEKDLNRGDNLMKKLERRLNLLAEDKEFQYEGTQYNKSNVGTTEVPYEPGIHFIPPVPEVSPSDHVEILSEKIRNPFIKLPPREYHEKIVILSPIHNVVNALERFSELLKSLTYPHHLISIVFGEDCSNDGTLDAAQKIVMDLGKSFRRAEVHHFNITGQVVGDWSTVHSYEQQRSRRQHLAKARNLLLKAGLKDEDWVLWIDSDLSKITKDLVQQLLSADKDVVSASALYVNEYNIHRTQRFNKLVEVRVPILRIYDKNSWRETNRSLASQKKIAKVELVIEGYSKTERIYLAHLKAEGRVVKLDGVGGCALLIRAACHRKGLIFPDEIYDHHLETEGLAKMAKHMGFGVYGMPFVEIFH